MGYVPALALRNVRRNRRRSLLAVISVALSIAFIVVMQGMTGGFLSSMVKNYTKNETGHVRITTTAFEEKARFNPVTENIADPDAIIEAIRTDPSLGEQVKTITERITFGVLLSNEGNNKTAMALAGDPQTEKELLMLERSILPGGRYIEGSRETIIGAGLADALGYRVGDTVKVMTKGSDYALHLRKLEVVGLFQTGLESLDDAVFQVTLDDARKLLRMGDAVQQIVIMLDDYNRADGVAEAIRTKLDNDDLAVLSWTEIGVYGRYVEMAGSAYMLIYVAVALLGAFIIGNIMMMVVLERRREIGILKAMGLTRLETLWLFLLEGAALGLIGSLVGGLVGTAVSLYFHFNGLDFTKALSSVSIPIDNVVHFTVSAGGITQALLIGTIVSALVALPASWQAARMTAVGAIKSV